MNSTLSVNWCHWTVVLAPSWTCRILHSYSTGRPRLRGVFQLNHSNMSPFHQKIVDWPQTTSASASASSLPYFLSWNRGGATNLKFLRLQRRMFAISRDTLLCPHLKTLLRSIIVNNSSTILDGQPRSPIGSLRRRMISLACISFFWIYSKISRTDFLTTSYFKKSGVNLVSSAHLFTIPQFWLVWMNRVDDTGTLDRILLSFVCLRFVHYTEKP